MFLLAGLGSFATMNLAATQIASIDGLLMFALITGTTWYLATRRPAKSGTVGQSWQRAAHPVGTRWRVKDGGVGR